MRACSDAFEAEQRSAAGERFYSGGAAEQRARMARARVRKRRGVAVEHAVGRRGQHVALRDRERPARGAQHAVGREIG